MHLIGYSIKRVNTTTSKVFRWDTGKYVYTITALYKIINLNVNT